MENKLKKIEKELSLLCKKERVLHEKRKSIVEKIKRSLIKKNIGKCFKIKGYTYDVGLSKSGTGYFLLYKEDIKIIGGNRCISIIYDKDGHYEVNFNDILNIEEYLIGGGYGLLFKDFSVEEIEYKTFKNAFNRTTNIISKKFNMVDFPTSEIE